MFNRMLFDPALITATRKHSNIYARYQQLYVAMDTGAAIAFIIGSVYFLDPQMKSAGEWLFLVGSVLFAFVPMITIAQDFHLGKLSTPAKK